MLLAIKRFLQHHRAPPDGAHPAADDVVHEASADPSADADAERLWQEARAEAEPFRRDALLLAAVNAMIASAGPALLRFCAAHVRDESDADDVAQRAFVTFWQVLPRFEGRSTLRTFLFGVALNLCRRHERGAARAARRLRAHEEAALAELELGSLPDDALERRDRVRALEAALSALSAKDAWLLRARLLQDLPYEQMLPRYQRRFGSQITSVEGLRTALFHARRRLVAVLRGDADG